MKPPEEAPMTEFRLRVQPEAPGQPWHATLWAADPPERLEFDSPLELARHLASLTDPQPKGKLR